MVFWVVTPPSLGRIVRYDSFSQVLLFVFALGAIGSYYLVDSAIFNFEHYPVGDWLIEEFNPFGVALCVGSVGALPLRMFLLRRLFRIGVEVEGTVERAPSSPDLTGRSRTPLEYSYVVDGTRHFKHRFLAQRLWDGYAERFRGRVPVIANPKRPRSAMLKHEFELDVANPLPDARTVDR